MAVLLTSARKKIPYGLEEEIAKNERYQHPENSGPLEVEFEWEHFHWVWDCSFNRGKPPFSRYTER
jgi:hypothetical protein